MINEYHEQRPTQDKHADKRHAAMTVLVEQMWLDGMHDDIESNGMGDGIYRIGRRTVEYESQGFRSMTKHANVRDAMNALTEWRDEHDPDWLNEYDECFEGDPQ